MPLQAITKNLFIRTVNDKSYYLVRCQRNGVRIERSLGRVEDIGLREAKRKASYIVSETIEDDVKPAKRQKKSGPTFAEVLPNALRSISEVKVWKNYKAYRQWEQSLTDYALPVLGQIPVNEITTEDVFQVLKPIWRTKTETASRVRMRIDA